MITVYSSYMRIFCNSPDSIKEQITMLLRHNNVLNNILWNAAMQNDVNQLEFHMCEQDEWITDCLVDLADQVSLINEQGQCINELCHDCDSLVC